MLVGDFDSRAAGLPVHWVDRSVLDMLDLLNRGMSTSCVAVFGWEAPLRKWGVHEAELIAVLSPKDFD